MPATMSEGQMYQNVILPAKKVNRGDVNSLVPRMINRCMDGQIKAKELPCASAAQSSSMHALLSITVIVRGSTAYLKVGKLILEATLTQVHIVRTTVSQCHGKALES
jgi:hypothetical protein